MHRNNAGFKSLNLNQQSNFNKLTNYFNFIIYYYKYCYGIINNAINYKVNNNDKKNRVNNTIAFNGNSIINDNGLSINAVKNNNEINTNNNTGNIENNNTGNTENNNTGNNKNKWINNNKSNILLLLGLNRLKELNIIMILVYSGSVLIPFLTVPFLNSNYTVVMVYLLFYINLIIALLVFILPNAKPDTKSSINKQSKYNSSINSIFIFPIIFYNLIGIPPFAGFFIKYISLSILTFNCSIYLYLFIVAIFIFGTLLVSYMYLNYYHYAIQLHHSSFISINFYLYISCALFLFLPIYFTSFMF